MNTEDNVKPCPNCKAPAKLHVDNVTTGHGSSDPAYQVICTGCGLRTRRIVTAMDLDPAPKGRLLVAEWNRRD